MIRGLFLLICLLLLPGAQSSEVAANDEKPILHVYTWEGYFSPDLLERFEDEYGCIIELEYYDSNETMIEKIQEGGGGYDIITPPGFAIDTLIRQGVIRKLDHSLLPNLTNIIKTSHSLLLDKNMEFSVPYTSTITVVGYNRDMVPDDALGSWEIFADPRFSGKLAMMNDMRETLGAALKYRGFSLNTTNPDEIMQAEFMLQSWKKNIALFSIDEARYGLRDGKYAAIQAYHGDIRQVAEENPKISFFIPREGSAFNSDKFVIGYDTNIPELAHAFINFFLDGDVAAQNMEEIKYAMPNSASGEILRDGLLFLLDDEMYHKCEVVKYIGPNDVHLYEDAWEHVLFGRSRY